MAQMIDLVGMRFGRLTVLKALPKCDDYSRLWECRCDCGAVHIVRGASLRRGLTKSCGCKRSEELAERNRHRYERTAV